MSVYTTIDARELQGFLAGYSQGKLLGFEGISSGIENTNYFVTTTAGEYVLTIFEQHTADELPFFLDLTAYLSEHDTPCAHPAMDNHGRYLGELKGKPASLVQRLRGQALETPEAIHCQAVGQVLAHLHVVGQQFPQRRDNDRGPHWWRVTAAKLETCLDQQDLDILHEEMHTQSQHRKDDLPRGIIHADLFRDNVLFENSRLSGLIDFYYACTDALMYDVAITVNDWCTHADGCLDPTRAAALLGAYQAVRPFNDRERAAWPTMLRAAALRFWLSRLHDMHFPREGEITHTKDPNVFKRILLDRRGDEQQLRALLANGGA